MYNSPMYYTNPAMQNAQQRLQMMEAQYPQFANPTSGYPQTQPQSQIRGRLVSNEEEANAAMIDFDGSLFVFLDKSHGKIYTKQLGLDGNIRFLRYSLETGASTFEEPKQEPAPSIDLSSYATKEELSRGLNDMKQFLTQQLDQLTRP